jgi:hypothetical protein
LKNDSFAIIAGISVAAAVGSAGIIFAWLYSTPVLPISTSLDKKWQILTQSDLDNVIITYDRGCALFCPQPPAPYHGHTIVVFGSTGTVIHKEYKMQTMTDGSSNVAVYYNVSKMTKEQTQELANQFYTLGFFMLNSQYGCDFPATDIPTEQVSFRILHGTSKSVCSIPGGHSSPVSLIELQKKIDQLPYQSTSITNCIEPDCTSDMIEQFNHALEIDEESDADTGLLASDDANNRENSVGVIEETDNNTQINIQYNDEIISK